MRYLSGLLLGLAVILTLLPWNGILNVSMPEMSGTDLYYRNYLDGIYKEMEKATKEGRKEDAERLRGEARVLVDEWGRKLRQEKPLLEISEGEENGIR